MRFDQLVKLTPCWHLPIVCEARESLCRDQDCCVPPTEHGILAVRHVLLGGHELIHRQNVLVGCVDRLSSLRCSRGTSVHALRRVCA